MSRKPLTHTRDLDRAQTMAEHGALDRAKACTSKQLYAHPNDARHALKTLFQHQGRKGLVYKCPFGDHWHISKLHHGEIPDATDEAA